MACERRQERSERASVGLEGVADAALRDRLSIEAPADPRGSLEPNDATASWAGKRVVRARSIGNTSFVLKITFQDGTEAAFKPRSRRELGHLRYRSEVAAYRLAQLLEVPNVPPAYFVGFSASEVLSTCVPRDVCEKGAFPNGETLFGALIPWIPDLSFFALEREAVRKRAHFLLRQEPLPDAGDERLRRDLVRMFAWDYLIANWDRESGGNVGIDPHDGSLLFIDNDGGFYEAPSEPFLQQQAAMLRTIRTWDAGFLENLRRADAETVSRALGEGEPGTPLLSRQQLAGLESRRMRLLSLTKGPPRDH